jgi:signal transduction histidine kinase
MFDHEELQFVLNESNAILWKTDLNLKFLNVACSSKINPHVNLIQSFKNLNNFIPELDQFKDPSKLDNSSTVLHKVKANDGEYLWFRSSFHPLLNEDRHFIGFKGVSVQVLEHKELLLELLQNSEFQTMIAEISTEFINANGDSLDETINRMLERVGRILGVDRSYIFALDWNKRVVNNTYEWCNDGIEPQIDVLQDLPFDNDKWWIEQIFGNKTIYFPDVNVMPAEAIFVQELIKSQGIKSFVVVPVYSNNQAIGFIGFDAVKEHRSWTKVQIKYLSILANILVEVQRRAIAEAEKIEMQKKVIHSSKMASIGHLAAGVAHEINNPLMVINGALHLIRRKSDDKITGYVDKIGAAVVRIAGITSSLTNFSKQQTDSFKKFNAHKSLELIMNDIAQVFAGDKLKFKFHFQAQNPNLSLDESLFKQLILNILSNARDAISEAQVEGLITVSTESIKEKFVITIEDNGTGIKQEHLAHVFDAFYTTKQVGEGSGLGLYVAHNIVTMFGGKIEVVSSNGSGTIVRIELDQ